MKNLAVLLMLVLFSSAAFAQLPPKSAPKKFRKTAPAKNSAQEKEEFDQAVALADAAERIQALQQFAKDFPKSTDKIRALELVTSARAALADEKYRAGERETAVELFKLAVREAPNPISDKLFAEILMQIPNSLLVRGEREAAIEIARLIEEKIGGGGSAKQLIGAATFYLGMENTQDARRLAEKALALEPNLPAAYQTLGLAHRLDFQLEESANAYQKALELDANSAISKRSLAEMKRATGKASEAAALYREILTQNPADEAAQTGLILALLAAGDKTEAENEMRKSLEANPKNLPLLVGAAYWYAAHDDGAKAVELAEKAVGIEPRYTWAQIALARGLVRQKRFSEAEKTLLAAGRYGDFPTLDYELATARFQSGFYREAAESLRKKFTVTDGSIRTRLGGRVVKEAKSFTELLNEERRASIFQTLAADDAETAERLKSLLDFSQKLENSNEDQMIAAADEFVKGDDKMKLHRQLFAANQLLDKRAALPKVLELTKASVAQVDAGLDVPQAAAAVLADELYQSRRIAIARSELIIVPELPRQMLSNIARGRIEDIAGWALFQENKSAEAVTRLKRAVSVLPEKSSWWRNSMWRLGAAQDAAGNQPDALDAYIKSYTSGEADAIKYGIIETVYQKINGNLDGLELKIGAKPAAVAADFPVQNPARVPVQIPVQRIPAYVPVQTEVKSEVKTVERPKAEIQSAPEIKSETAPTPPVSVAAETVQPTAETKSPALPTPEVSNAETPVKIEAAPPSAETKKEVETEKPKAEPKIEVEEPKIEPKVGIEEPKVQKKAETEEPKVEKKVEIEEPKIEKKIEAEEPETEDPKVERKIEEPKVEPKPEKMIVEIVETKPEIKTEPKIEAKPKIEAEPTPDNQLSEDESKPLFNPVVISVPKIESAEKPADAKPEVEPQPEPEKEPDKPIENAAPKTEPRTDETVAAKKSAADFKTRPRVVVTQTIAVTEPAAERTAPCKITVGQETISILNDGGNLSVLARFENETAASREIKAASSSPADVEVVAQPAMEGISERGVFFVIRSISPKTGTFAVTFEATCGRKEISVKVR